MEKQNSSVYLAQEINTNIQILKKKVQSQKNKTRLFNGLSIALGALITLTLGIKATGFEELQKNVALVLGALLTIINGWNAMFDYKKLWRRQKSTLLDLYQLKNELGFRLAHSNPDTIDVADLFSRYQDVWERDGNEWRNIIHTQHRTENSLQLQPSSNTTSK
ncbi:conserved hypothetical protein [Vibrio crassostreae]|uniref:DUF4231 domain-containing protein n=1 Tax=Vibrio crassostreae TaxID=246167 RepID=UPI000F4839C6|nr:DUF4231 domain-containing protein [Vibrio crassostreae]ROR15642.1 uncharacterized protein DUF4231 [Vibrio crassostreae]CAK1759073.1 conserved hypothetical protein [Vibrio crassostreae]CAK2265354.1 conserved hypothetical protein [Vibrio crassostreae]CAK2282062.1 conserved hypothetical protein [Vibrio crassostreae]CAK3081728.1 conserved hypothetical protein [Vibrio crassostreae]